MKTRSSGKAELPPLASHSSRSFSPRQKWRKFWGILYRESSCSTARLELFEGSVPPAAEKLRKGEGGKRLVKLSDCVHVAEASGDAGCPKETVPFLLETTEKRYLLAADGSETPGWIQKLCELAFPVRAGQGERWEAVGSVRGVPGGRCDGEGEGDACSG